MLGCYVTTKDLNPLAQVNMNEPSNSLAFTAAPSSGLNALIKSCAVLRSLHTQNLEFFTALEH